MFLKATSTKYLVPQDRAANWLKLNLLDTVLKICTALVTVLVILNLNPVIFGAELHTTFSDIDVNVAPHCAPILENGEGV